MEFAFIGILVGKFWTWLVVRQLRRFSITRGSPTLQLCAYIFIAAITGLAIGFVERHVFSGGRPGRSLSNGLITGFLWSAWFVAGARVLYAQGRTARALSYLMAAPLLVLAAVLGGYSTFHFEHRLA